jgi:hypothetical protein
VPGLVVWARALPAPMASTSPAITSFMKELLCCSLRSKLADLDYGSDTLLRRKHVRREGNVPDRPLASLQWLLTGLPGSWTGLEPLRWNCAPRSAFTEQSPDGIFLSPASSGPRRPPLPFPIRTAWAFLLPWRNSPGIFPGKSWGWVILPRIEIGRPRRQSRLFPEAPRRSRRQPGLAAPLGARLSTPCAS